MIVTALKTLQRYTPLSHLFIQKELSQLRQKAHIQLENELLGETFLYASSASGHFHHGFGRDTAFNAWFINIAYDHNPEKGVWARTKKALLTYWSFQQPDGKIPHELKPFSPDDALGQRGFYDRYKDYYINCDSVDATALMLIVTALYIKKGTEDFSRLTPQIIKALEWIEINLSDNNGWLAYQSNRKGLVSQGWMDSQHGGPVDENGELVDGHVVLVEAQAFAWKALLAWADLLEDIYPTKSIEWRERAKKLKKQFNKYFLTKDSKGVYFSHAIIFEKDSWKIKKRITSISINAGLCLWASYYKKSIIEDEYMQEVAERLLSREMFHKEAGIFTFAKGHSLKNGDGYHNGEKVVWPFASIAVAYGVMDLGGLYAWKAKRILKASIIPILIEKSFIEQATYLKKRKYVRYVSSSGAVSCKDQTWTVTAYLAAMKTLHINKNEILSMLPKLSEMIVIPFKNVVKMMPVN